MAARPAPASARHATRYRSRGGMGNPARRWVCADQLVERVDGGGLLGVDRDLDHHALALGASNRVARVLVEAGQQRLVVDEVDDPGLARPATCPATGAGHGPRRRRAPGAPASSRGSSFTAIAPCRLRHLAQANRQRTNPLRRARVGVVEHRAVRHVPEGPTAPEGTFLRRDEGDDRAVLLEEVAALRLAVEGGHLGPGPVMQEVARRGRTKERLPRCGIGLGGRSQVHQAVLSRRRRR